MSSHDHSSNPLRPWWSSANHTPREMDRSGSMRLYEDDPAVNGSQEYDGEHDLGEQGFDDEWYGRTAGHEHFSSGPPQETSEWGYPQPRRPEPVSGFFPDEDIIQEDEEMADLADEDVAMYDLVGSSHVRDEYAQSNLASQQTTDYNSANAQVPLAGDYQNERQSRGVPGDGMGGSSTTNHLSQLLITAGMDPRRVSEMTEDQKLTALQRRLASPQYPPPNRYHPNDIGRGGIRPAPPGLPRSAFVSSVSQGGSSRRSRQNDRPPTPRGGRRFFRSRGNRGRGRGRGRGRRSRQPAPTNHGFNTVQSPDIPPPPTARVSNDTHSAALQENDISGRLAFGGTNVFF